MQVEHHLESAFSENEIADIFRGDYQRFNQVQDFDQEKMEEELAKPEVKEVHVFKRGGLAEINAQLRHDEPHLTRRNRRKKAVNMLRARKNG